MGTTAAPAWKSNFLGSLTQTNNECRGYVNLIGEYQKLIESSVSKSKTISSLNKQAADLREHNTMLFSELAQLKESGIAETRKKVEDLDLKLRTQQEELTALYKTKYEKTEEVLLLKQNEKNLETELKAAVSENQDLRRIIEERSGMIAELEHKVQDSASAMQVLKFEYEAVKAEKEKAASELASALRQVDGLTHKLLERAQKDAEMFNQMIENDEKRRKSKDADERIKRAQSDFGADLNPIYANMSMIPQQKKFTIDAHQSEGNDVCYSHSGVLASASTDKDIKLWDSHGAHMITLTGQSQAVMSTHFSPNEEFILGASNDNTVRVWRSKTGQTLHALTGHTNKIFSARFYYDHTRVVSGSCDRTIKYWDLNRGYCTRTTLCMSSCNSVSPDNTGAMVASGHFDKTLRVWDVRDGTEVIKVDDAHSQQVAHVAFSPDGHFIMSCSRDSIIKIYDARTYEVVKQLSHNKLQIPKDWAKPCWSPDSRYVAAGGHDGNVFLLNVASGETEILTGGHDSNSHITACAWSMVQSTLATIDKHGRVVVWGPK
eukprot:c101_g1_i1.p1 GENE.c101_g1_i1~~c101_g1_i1.p1  ORF type:complete len:573 (-),score=148.01 c101_g1_i1:272-1912(-)